MALKAYYVGFRKYLPLLQNLTMRDLKVKYRRSVLGIAWSILNPLLTMLVLTQVFGRLMKIQVENFPVYYILGATIFNFFSEATQNSLSSVLSAGALIKKVYIPKYIFPLEKCMFAFVNQLFSMIAVLIVMIFQRTAFHWTMILFFIPMIYVFVFAVGMSLILSSLTVYFRDIMHLYGVLITIWMYLTPLIYPIELIEGSWIMHIVRCNPLYYYMQYFRDVMMYGIVPGWEWNLICLAFSVGVLAIGVLIFKRLQDRFILHI